MSLKSLPKLEILIADDEPLARKKIARILLNYHGNSNLRFAANGAEVLERIEQKMPDLIFLDIEMPGLTGLEALQKLRNRTFEVVLQTAFAEHAVCAFSENACDYLLKPFSEQRLLQSLYRAFDRMENRKKAEELSRLKRTQSKFLQCLRVKIGSSHEQIPIENFECFFSQEHLTLGYVNQRELVIGPSIQELETTLNPVSFVRCHRSTIVNLKQIKKITEAGVVTQSGKSLKLSRRRKNQVKQIWLKGNTMPE